MAFFGLFGADKPTKDNIDKLVAKVKQTYAQPEYRREAMDRLLAFGTEEALIGVMQRFTSVAQSPHWDEDEKRWLVDELVARGETARVAILKFLTLDNHIAFAAAALRRLSDDASYVAQLVAALRSREPEDHRSRQGKTELIAAIADAGQADVGDALVPFVDDHADEVQIAAIDAIVTLCRAEPLTPAAVAAFSQLLVDDTRSPRVLRHCAKVAVERQLTVTGTLAPALGEDGYVVAGGKIVRPVG